MKQKIIILLSAALLLAATGCAPAASSAAQEPAADHSSSSQAPSLRVDNSGALLSLLTSAKTAQAFASDPVPEEDVQTILQAGANAPSAMNQQPWHFSVVTSAEVLQQIQDGMSAGAPRVPGDGEGKPAPAEASGDERAEPSEAPPEGGVEPPERPDGEASGAGQPPVRERSRKAGLTDAPLAIVVSGPEGSEFDCGLACENMSVAALALGYGTKIVSSPTIALNGENQEKYRELLDIPDGMSAVAVLLVGAVPQVDEADTVAGASVRNPLEDTATYID